MAHRNPLLLSVKILGSNQTQIRHGDTTILYSYETPVAVFVVGEGYFVTEKKWSITTKRHINKWLVSMGANQAEKISQKVLDHIAETGQGPEGYEA